MKRHRENSEQADAGGRDIGHRRDGGARRLLPCADGSRRLAVRLIFEQLGGTSGAMPRKDGATFALRCARDGGRVTPERKRILLVEDDRFLRRACEASLQQRGFDVTTATDGEEGLRLLKSERFDLVLL